MQMTNELYQCAERCFGMANLKPKDVGEVLGKLESEFGIAATVVGNYLELRQGEQLMSTGTVLTALRDKHPRLFFGSAGSINFTLDLLVMKLPKFGSSTHTV